ncbi:MAG: sigma-70 family RNA polymerase sigma factor [Peptostreptococcaceae bacterium]|nr:sigma-70 family RNA polymerase sigma factor [Peptostreptococcaceae bacterium]
MVDTKKPDEELVALAKNGDSSAEEYLINKYKGMARHKSNTYFIAGADKEDVVQEGMIGIFKAIRDYDENAGTSFSTFAELCIRRQIINAIKSADRKKNKALNESLSIYADSNNESIEYDNIPLTNDLDTESKIVYNEFFEFMNKKNSMFSDFERDVWIEKFSGNTYTEIAEKLNKSPKTIDNALQRIKKKMNKILMND